MNLQRIAYVAALLRSARYLVALTGAGLSRPSGIPDFRSDGGIWSQHAPLEVASLHAFRRHPQRFYDWFRPLLDCLLKAQPNPAHSALAQLEQQGRLRAVITQNIDGLHQRAGSREVFELHGHLRSASCLDCDRQIPAAPLLEQMQRGTIPRCTCGGLFKPDVVLFDELLPQGLLNLARHTVAQCDALLVAGTSLEVWPVNNLPREAKQRGAKLIIINQSETYLDDQADVVLHQDVAIALPAIVSTIAGSEEC